MVAGSQSECGLARRREVDLVAPRLQIGAERPQDLGLVVDDEDACHPPSGGGTRSSAPRPGCPPSPLRRPSPRRIPSPRRARVPLLRHCRSRRGAGTGGRCPGGPAEHQARDRRLERPRLPDGARGTRTRRPAGERRAFTITFASARSSRPGSASTRGSVSGTSSRPPRHRAQAVSAPGGSRRAQAPSRLTSSAPVWRRLMSRRLPTRELRRSASSSIVPGTRGSRGSTRRRPAGGSSPRP